MAEPKLIPQTFQAQPNSIASYDYIDLEEGIGGVSYQAYTSEDSDALKYWMNRNATYSSNGNTTFVNTGNAVTQYRSAPFRTFNFLQPRTMLGTGQVAFSSESTTGLTLYKRNGDEDEEQEVLAGAGAGDTDFNFDVVINTSCYLSRITFGTSGGAAGNYVTVKVTEGTGTGGTVIAQNTILTTAATNYTWRPEKCEHLHIIESGTINIRIYRSAGASTSILKLTGYTYDGVYFDITSQEVHTSIGGDGVITFTKVDYTEIVSRVTSPSGSSSKVVTFDITQTHFPRGSAIVFWMDGNNGNGIELAHDPENKDQGVFVAADNHTTCVIKLPFRLEQTGA